MVQIMVAASLSLGFAMTHARCYPFKTMQANFLKLTADTALVLNLLITAVMRTAEMKTKLLHTDDLNQEDVLGPIVLSSLMVIISVGMPAVVMIYNHSKCRQTLPEDEEQGTATRIEMQDMSAERHQPPVRLLEELMRLLQGVPVGVQSLKASGLGKFAKKMAKVCETPP